jgi:Na+-driven multidrug efflux pump
MNATRHRNLVPAPMARYDDRTVAALAFGVAGLFMFNLICGPLAVALGIGAARRTGADRRQRIAARAAVLLGVADVVVFGVLLALKLRTGWLV